MLAEYYCKKMGGKNATLAGDPTMRVKRRKLGIVVAEEPPTSTCASTSSSQVTDEMCGSAERRHRDLHATSPTSTTRPGPAAPTLVTRMKNDGSPPSRATRRQRPRLRRVRPRSSTSPSTSSRARPARLRRPRPALRPSQRGNRLRATASARRSRLRRATTPPSCWRGSRDHGPEHIAEGNLPRLLDDDRHDAPGGGADAQPADRRAGACSSTQYGGRLSRDQWPGCEVLRPSVRSSEPTATTTISDFGDVREVYWSDTASLAGRRQVGGVRRA